MINYATKRQSFSELCLATLKIYPHIFTAVLPLALLLGVLNSLYFVALFEFAYLWLKVSAVIILMLLQVYLWAAALRCVDQRIKNNKVALAKICLETWQRISSIYSAFFLMTLLCCLVFLAGYTVLRVFSMVVPDSPQIHLVLIMAFISIPSLLVSVWLLMLMPQCAVLTKTILHALRDCFRWIGTRNWLVTFALYIVTLVLLYMGYPDSRHMHWLNSHFLRLVFNAVLYALFTPLLTGYTLLLLNRIKQLQAH